jgi:hypothetical protein
MATPMPIVRRPAARRLPPHEALEPEPKPDPSRRDERPGVGPGGEEVERVLDRQHDSRHRHDGSGYAETREVADGEPQDQERHARQYHEYRPAVVAQVEAERGLRYELLEQIGRPDQDQDHSKEQASAADPSFHWLHSSAL